MNILALFACYAPLMSRTCLRQLALIAEAVLRIPSRVTMLGLSRWTEKGGSYRTLQRFFGLRLPWSQLLVKFFETHLFASEREYLLAGDATTVTKAGSETFGVDRFFSGLVGKIVKGLEFFVFSLVDVTARKSYPLSVKQTVRSAEEKAEQRERKKKRQRSKNQPRVVKGRKPGSRNRDKSRLELSPELLRINDLLRFLVSLLRRFVNVSYLVLDGHFGHNQAVLMARANELHLISKLRRDAALYEKYDGQYSGRGRRKKYGARLKYDNLPAVCWQKSERKKELVTNYYQGIFLHKEFAYPLNVVIIVKINLKTKKTGHALLFSSDVELGWEKLVVYYSLRFQLEFNFRDAKQHFGLEDFMNTKEVGVENAVNLSFLMVNLSAKLITESAGRCVGVNDLKTQSRGVKYALATIKLVLKKPEPILINRIKEAIGRLGSIHKPNIAPPPT